MEIVYNVEIEVLSLTGAGQVENFIAHMSERTNPHRVGSEREYKLAGKLNSGIIVSMLSYDTEAQRATDGERRAIMRALTLTPGASDA